MKEQLDKILASMKAFWKAQDKKRRAGIIITVLAVLLLAVITTAILNHKTYVVLYDGLEGVEASEIAAQIQEMGVECSFTADGTITVPEEQEEYLRMQLGVLGYPKSAYGYDFALANIGAFTTDSQSREVYRMQLEQNLKAAIETFSDVDTAIVLLSIPEQKNTVVGTNKQLPSASVVLQLMPGRELSTSQVRGIQHLVLTCSPGFTEENITITDGTGALLFTEETSPDTMKLEQQKLRFKQDFENILRDKAMTILIPSYGEGGVSVAVTANLNFDKKVSENTEYTPSRTDPETGDEQGMLQHRDDSATQGGTGEDGGVVGIEPNADDTYPTGTVEGESFWYSSDDSETYLVNTLKEQVEKAGYSIDGLSCAVVIYQDYISDNVREQVQNAVAMATNINPDYVSVANLTKLEDTILPAAAEDTYLFGLTLVQLLIAAGILLLLIIIMIIVFAAASRRAKKRRKALEKQIQEAARAGENGVTMGYFGGTGEKISVASLTEDRHTMEDAVREEIGNFAEHSPEIVAQLLKTWIKEDEETV